LAPVPATSLAGARSGAHSTGSLREYAVTALLTAALLAALVLV